MVAQLINHIHHLAMHTSMSDSNYNNRRMQLTPVHQKPQNASCNGIGDGDEKKSENDSDEHLTPFERRLRWMRSRGPQTKSSKRSLSESSEGLSPIQRKVMNYIGGGVVRKDADANDNKLQMGSPATSEKNVPIPTIFKSPMKREYSSSSLFDSPESHPGRDERRKSPLRRLKASSSGKGEDIRKTPKRDKSASSRSERTKTSSSRMDSRSPHGRKMLTSSSRNESFRKTPKKDKSSSSISRSESFRKTPKREKSSSSSKGDSHRKTPKREKSSSSSKGDVTKKSPKREKSSSSSNRESTRKAPKREKSKEGTRKTPKRDKSSSSRSERDRKPLPRRARSSLSSKEECRTRIPVRRAKSTSDKGEITEEPLAAEPFTAEPTPQQERTDFQQNTKPLFRSNPRTRKRQGVGMEIKPASTGDLVTLSRANTKSGNGHHLLLKMKQERRVSEADCGLSSLANEKFNFESENSLFNTLTKGIKQLQLQDLGSTCSADDNSFYQDANSAFGDFGSNHRRRRKKEQKPPEDDISFGSSPFKNVTTKDQQRRASDNSIDLNSFFDQGFGNENEHRWRCRSKSQDVTQKGDEKHPQQQEQEQQQTQPSSKNNECSISEGLVLHSSKDFAVSSHDEDDSPRRKSKQCSSGGKVRNNRTQEEYTGFFLTSSTQDNIKHGYGITKFPDGRVFEGVYKQGNMAEGKMSYPAAPDGDTAIFQNADLCRSCGFAATYIGRFDEAGLRCSKGIYITETTTFLGEFFLDEQDGSGILIYHDDTDDVKFRGMAVTGNMSKCRRFVGHWKGGYRHGYGREILADGTIHLEGLWEAGHHVGPVV